MKRFLIGILFVLTTFLGYSQGSSKDYITQTNWSLENKGEWGEFYWKVNRSSYADANGRYWYYMYFYSNALFKTKSDGINYDRASCYIKGVTMTIQERKYIGGPIYNETSVYTPYIICDYLYELDYYVAYFYSYSPYCTFNVDFKEASPYDYSLYYTK